MPSRGAHSSRAPAVLQPRGCRTGSQWRCAAAPRPTHPCLAWPDQARRPGVGRARAGATPSTARYGVAASWQPSSPPWCLTGPASGLLLLALPGPPFAPAAGPATGPAMGQPRPASAAMSFDGAVIAAASRPGYSAATARSPRLRLTLHCNQHAEAKDVALQFFINNFKKLWRPLFPITWTCKISRSQNF